MTTSNFTMRAGVLRSPVSKKDMSIDNGNLHLGYKEVVTTLKTMLAMFLIKSKGFKVETVTEKLASMRENETEENRELVTEFIGDGIPVRIANTLKKGPTVTLLGLTKSSLVEAVSPATSAPVVTPPNATVVPPVTPTTEDQA